MAMGRAGMIKTNENNTKDYSKKKKITNPKHGMQPLKSTVSREHNSHVSVFSKTRTPTKSPSLNRTVSLCT